MNLLLKFTRCTHIPLTFRRKIGKRLLLNQDEIFQINMFGQVYEGKLGNYIDDKIYTYGLYEPATIQLLRFLCINKKIYSDNLVYVDVGCNTGMHLIALSDVIDIGYGFEPWEFVREKAKNNLSINNISHIKIFNFGLSKSSGKLPFLLPNKSNLGMGSFLFDKNKNDDINSITLPFKKGDDLFLKENIAPSVIKIDVEGFENNVLIGMKETMFIYKPAIIFEFNEPTRKKFNSINKIKDIFCDGYEFYGIIRAREKLKLRPLNPEKKYENILAIHDDDIKSLGKLKIRSIF